MPSVTPIPAFNDNYIWAIADGEDVVLVDPGDASKAIAYLYANHLKLNAILITHHHDDHTGGAEVLSTHFSCPVYGPANSPYAGITHPLTEGESIELLGETYQVKQVPGHTLDHIAYYVDKELPALFCGDTLFLAGCGRLFEGTPEQMLAAMDYFSALPANTQVYCTHEYSLANLRFAKAVEPNNEAIDYSLASCTELREKHLPTLPTNIARERAHNPFMRVDEPAVSMASTSYAEKSITSRVDVFATLREWKNNF